MRQKGLAFGMSIRTGNQQLINFLLGRARRAEFKIVLPGARQGMSACLPVPELNLLEGPADVFQILCTQKVCNVDDHKRCGSLAWQEDARFFGILEPTK